MISNATSLTKITYKQPELLWENPATTYGGGVLNFSGNYSMYIVEFTGINSSSPSRYIKMAITLSESAFYAGAKAQSNSTATVLYVRRFNYVRANSISMGTGYYSSTSSDRSDTYAVPVRIWGIPT